MFLSFFFKLHSAFSFVCFYGIDGPEVSCSDSLLMVKEGTALGDVCNVTGNPIKSVQWLKDGNEAKQSIPLTKDEYGNYTLKVDGSELFEQNFTIHVLCKYLANCI